MTQYTPGIELGTSGDNGEWRLVTSAEMEPIGVVSAVTAVSIPLLEGRFPVETPKNILASY